MKYNEFIFISYIDVDYGRDIDVRSLILRLIYKLGNVLIEWFSKWLVIIVLSIIEVEYRVFFKVVKDVIYLCCMFNEL